MSIFEFSALPLWSMLIVFAVSAIAIGFAGVRLTNKADILADRTGMGEAVAGAVLLGMSTSLSGAMVSITAGLDGQSSLAFSNAVGGIAVQTAFLAVADIAYRKANLEHASADLSNLFQAALLTLMLGLVLAAYTGPDWSFWGIHPVSLALPLIYIAGVRTSARIRDKPMWQPVTTDYTRKDTPDEDDASDRPLLPLLVEFAILAIILAAAGWFISKSGTQISERLGISATAVGALLTAVVTSMPELVTTLAAVRRGAAQLAVGGIIGGNSFDVLFLSAADGTFRAGSIYHAIEPADVFWVATGLVVSAIMLIGLIVREKTGPGRIGFESAFILAVYGGAVAIQISSG